MSSTFTERNISFIIAETIQDFADGKEFFQQYANSLDFDLGFQGFADELIKIGSQYNKPKGSLLLAYDENIAFACIAIREFAKDTAELKRMFVQPAYRELKVGHKLLGMAIDTAKELGYKKMLLDTVPGMKAAIQLYHAFGFEEVSSYRFNPVPGAVFMEKKLV